MFSSNTLFTKRKTPGSASQANKTHAIDLNVFDDVSSVETKDERYAGDQHNNELPVGGKSSSSSSRHTHLEPKEESKDAPQAATPPSSTAGVRASPDDEASKRRSSREARYRKEMNDLRETIVSQRNMWEQLVKESEAQVADMRTQLASMTKERDSLRHDVEATKLRFDSKSKELTDELIRFKMRVAEISAEAQMLEHHGQLVSRRRDDALSKKRSLGSVFHNSSAVFHTCVEDDATTDDDAKASAAA